ncbi:MAG: heavy-metal-associated domain-containing protein [Pseudobdellovibrionaceae bacterium]
MFEFKVKGMTCPSCARVMRKAISSLDPEVDLEINLPAQTVKVKTNKTEQEIASIIEEAGYPVLESRQIS